MDQVKHSRRAKHCKGGATLKQLRKTAKSCGVKKSAKTNKCKLSRKLAESRCKKVKVLSSRSKLAMLKSPKHSRKHVHKRHGKHVILM